MSREPGPKTTTLGASMADSITLRSATIVQEGARGKFPGGVKSDALRNFIFCATFN